MKAIRTSICSALVLCCAAAFMWTAEAEMQDTDFWTEAAQMSMAEVALSNVALQRAQSDAVKQFAQQMVTDHTQANQELAAAAQAKGVTIPTSLPERRQRDVTNLTGEDAANFDREYMEMMVKDHERAVRLFQRQAERGTDADAKAWAAKMLPTLQGHLTMARSLHATVRGSRGGNNNRGNSSEGNASNVNRSTNVRQDADRNPNRNGNANANGNTNTNTNRNRNRNNNTNTGNTNGNTNGNTGNMNHR